MEEHLTTGGVGSGSLVLRLDTLVNQWISLLLARNLTEIGVGSAAVIIAV